MLTDRSFQAKPWLRATLAILGSMSAQGEVIHWVADHRRHHTFTDEEGDPHSPHTHSSEGWRGVLAGLWHSHMGWLFEDQHSSARRYAPDLRKDPVIRRVDKLFPLWVPARARDPLPRRARVVGRLGARRPDRLRLGGVGARVPAPSRHLERELDLPHVRPPALRHQGREPRQLARRARIARRRLAPQPPCLPDLSAPRPARTQIDPSYAIIRILERLGLVWNVKQPRPEQIAAKQDAPGITPLGAADRRAA